MKKNICALLVLFFLISNVHSQEIFEAVLKGDLVKVKDLVEKNRQQVNSRNEYGHTPLRIAARRDNVEIACFLIENGADINAQDNYGYSPLMVAGDKVSKLLIDKEAVFDTKDKWGATLLEISVNNHRHRTTEYVLKKMLSKKAEIKKSVYRTNLMHLAAGCGSVEVISQLINSGFNVNDTNIYRWTPLHFAAEQGQKDAAVLLIEKGADIIARTIDGYSPYNLAIEAGNKEIADYLMLKGADQSDIQFPYLSGKFFGQKNPGKTLALFPPGILFAKYPYHTSPIFSKDGTEAYWSVLQYGKIRNKVIIETKLQNGRWTPPNLASFCISEANDDAPFVSPDGKKLFFISMRPTNESGKMEKENIWVMEKTDSGWSQPAPLPPVINSLEGIHHQFSVDMKGNLYFAASPKDSFGEKDIYCSRLENGEYQKPFNLGNQINGADVENTPFISPDGSYLIFCKYNSSGWALYISFKKKNADWTTPIKLSEALQSPWEMSTDCPYVTSDNKFLLFQGLLENTGSLFWVDASFIEDLRKEALKDDY